MGPGQLSSSADGDVSKRQQFRVLMVCTANICRSPLAEHLLRRAVEDDVAGSPTPEVVVRSAGTQGWDGAEMDPAAAAQLQRLGGDPTGFLATSLQTTYCEAADLILTATLAHRATVLQEVPQALKRTFTLLEFAHLVEHNEHVRSAAGDPRELVSRAAAARGAAELELYDVPDPYGANAGFHTETANLVDQAVRAIATSFTSRMPL